MSVPPKILRGCEVLDAMDPPSVRPLRPAKGQPKSARFAALNAFVDASLRQVSGTAAKVWLILFRDTKPNGLVRGSDADLGRRAGVSDRTVRTVRRQLEEAGLLIVVRRGSLATGASTYRVVPLAEAGFRLSQEETCQSSRKQASAFPERDQNGHLDPVGSDAKKQKKRRPSAAGGAS